MSYKKIISAVASVGIALSVAIFPSEKQLNNIVGNYSITADSAFISNRLYNQWNAKWASVIFNKYAFTANSLQTSGCGVFAFCNAVYALNGTIADPTEVATWAVSIGALQPGNGGTYRYPFFDNVQSAFGSKLGFSVYGYASGKVTDSRLVTHLMGGGVAIVNVPGHFMAITGYNPSNGTYHVIESAVSASRGMSPDSWVPAEKMSSGGTNVSWYALLGNNGINNRVPTAPENLGYKLENFGDEFFARIKNISTERYITNIGGNVGGTVAEISDNQIWKFQIQNDGSYRISSVSDGTVMSLSDSINICTSADNGSISQRFHIYGKSDKYYIKPVGTDPFINMAMGSGNVEVSINSADLPPQEFDIIKVDLEELLPANVGKNFSAMIKNPSTGRYLTNNGGNVTADVSDYNAGGQIWDFQIQPDGSYKITSSADKGCISVEDYDNAVDGANLQTEQDNGSYSQKYYIYKAYGAYYLRAFGSDLFVNVTETDNADVRGYITNWSTQKFEIEKIIMGDLNNDGKVNSDDATLFKNWLMGKNVDICLQNADLSGDGVIDSFDLAMFKQIIVEERFTQIKQNLIDIYINHRTN